MKEVELLLIRLKTPENIGSIYRLAMQYKIKKIYKYKCINILTKGLLRTDVFNGQKHIPTQEIDSLDFLKTYLYPKYILETNGESIINKKSDDKFLLAVAHEGRGATKKELQLFDSVLTIPAPNCELNEHLISYNVSHALAIGMYSLNYQN